MSPIKLSSVLPACVFLILKILQYSISIGYLIIHGKLECIFNSGGAVLVAGLLQKSKVQEALQKTVCQCDSNRELTR